MVITCVLTYVNNNKGEYKMNTHKKILTMTLSALLIAVGIVIPMISPIKIQIGPMSFTLASHVAIMIALFISPQVSVAVALGTTLGFLLAGFPDVVVLRALSHVIWAALGGFYIKKHADLFQSPTKTLFFNLVIALIHAAGEMIVVVPFYYGAGMDIQAFCYMVFGLVGLGTIIHSSVDFIISLVVWKGLSQNTHISDISQVKKVYLIKNA